MLPAAPILTHDIVLVGGGHTHALVLKTWGMAPVPGARLTLIDPGPRTAYSGMLPGHVAGHYRREDLDIDLARLCGFAGARRIEGRAVGLDLDAGLVRVEGQAPVAFDLCSIDVGITSAMPEVPGFAEHAVPAKPLGPFAAAWQTFLSGDGPGRVAVIGGGVAGAELAMAMAHALRASGRAGGVTLIEADRVVATLGPRARARVLAAMDALGIERREGARLLKIAEGRVETTAGAIEADFITGAAGARPYDWFADTGLELHDGFIAVDRYLTTSDPRVFAAGDCAHLTFDPRPKAGVYAVRAAPIIAHNLRAVVLGRPKRAFHPQRDYLKLISLGEKSALAEKWGVTLSGPMLWRWKDRIDRRFMDRLNDLAAPETDTADDPTRPAPLCAGCGAKVARSALGPVLESHRGAARDDVTDLPWDDAALLQTGGVRQVLTTDHLRAFTADHVAMGRIAAIHALGDVWAMGAEPQAAVLTLILPRMSERLQARTVGEITAAVSGVLAEAGAALVGGHTSMGSELTVGLSVTGLLDRDPITLAGASPGDALILTKPIGTGTILAAAMRHRADADQIDAAMAAMSRAQGQAARILSGAHAMTDVTGFGLAAHLKGICVASGCGAELEAGAIPLLPGAAELAEAGIRSTLWPSNRAEVPELPEDHPLLFDPQTAGGLLAAVAPAEADRLVSDLRAGGDAAQVIGRIVEGPPLVSLR